MSFAEDRTKNTRATSGMVKEAREIQAPACFQVWTEAL